MSETSPPPAKDRRHEGIDPTADVLVGVTLAYVGLVSELIDAGHLPSDKITQRLKFLSATCSELGAKRGAEWISEIGALLSERSKRQGEGANG